MIRSIARLGLRPWPTRVGGGGVQVFGGFFVQGLGVTHARETPPPPYSFARSYAFSLNYMFFFNSRNYGTVVWNGYRFTARQTNRPTDPFFALRGAESLGRVMTHATREVLPRAHPFFGHFVFSV